MDDSGEESEAEVRGYLARGADASDLLNHYDWSCSPEVVKLLLEAGANPNNVDPKSPEFTPLYIAVSKNSSPEVVKLLIEAGADPNQTLEISTLLMEVIEGGDTATKTQTVKLLLEAGADPNKANPEFPDATPLSVARSGDSSEIVDLLIEAGAK
ncbi:MAG: ankyrin repeat domain-containing protein [Verrucomicrobiota bacterium]|nr:ankyrin repeat domain-containing protein [Verrucomicrobiota bacterium]